MRNVCLALGLTAAIIIGTVAETARAASAYPQEQDFLSFLVSSFSDEQAVLNAVQDRNIPDLHDACASLRYDAVHASALMPFIPKKKYSKYELAEFHATFDGFANAGEVCTRALSTNPPDADLLRSVATILLDTAPHQYKVYKISGLCPHAKPCSIKRVA